MVVVIDIGLEVKTFALVRSTLGAIRMRVNFRETRYAWPESNLASP